MGYGISFTCNPTVKWTFVSCVTSRSARNNKILLEFTHTHVVLHVQHTVKCLVANRCQLNIYVRQTLLQCNTIRPGTDQSSKAAFGKSAFAKTFSNVLSFVKDKIGAHQSSKKQKYFRTRFGTCNEQNAIC